MWKRLGTSHRTWESYFLPNPPIGEITVGLFNRRWVTSLGSRVLRIQDWPQEFSPPWLVNVGGIKVRAFCIYLKWLQLPNCTVCEKREAVRYLESEQRYYCADCERELNPKKQKIDVKSDIQWHIQGARVFFEEIYKYLFGKEMDEDWKLFDQTRTAKFPFNRGFEEQDIWLLCLWLVPEKVLLESNHPWYV